MTSVREVETLIQRVAQQDGQLSWDCRFAGYQVERALIQLEIARLDLIGSLARYIDAEEEFLEDIRGPVGARRMMPREIAVHDVYHEALDELPFRMEVYLYEARIVLDRVARFLHFAFRPASCEIGSHSSLAKLLPKVAEDHGVVVPDHLMAHIGELTNDVKVIRDRFIVHPSGPYGHLIRRIASVEPDGVVRLKIKWASRTAEGETGLEPVTSADFAELDTSIKRYVREVVALIERRLDDSAL